MVLKKENCKITPAQYIEFEKTATVRHEYLDGEIFAMVGASLNHNRINANTVSELRNKLKNSSCEAFASDMRVKIQEIEKYTYPDIVATCGDIDLESGEPDTLLNPIVIIEILSDSTESYDRGLKFEHYQHIQSLREYILISQDRCRIEKFKKAEDATWIYSSYTEKTQAVPIESINCDISLSEIYHRVEFDPVTHPQP